MGSVAQQHEVVIVAGDPDAILTLVAQIFGPVKGDEGAFDGASAINSVQSIRASSARLFDDIFEPQIGWSIHYQTKCSFGIVFGDVDNRAEKILIAKHGGRDQQLPLN